MERILSFHMNRQSKNESISDLTSAFANKRIMHPGSGNSLLPIYLRDKYSSLQQSVVDCSMVAIQDMQTRHDALYQKQEQEQKESKTDAGNLSSCRIDYVVADLLTDEPLSFGKDSFDAWVDKGFVDALFSSFDESEKQKCRRLFQEACRILSYESDDTGTTEDKGGIALVVTLAQDHSLRLLLDAIDETNNRSENNSDCNSLWKPLIHIHELAPLQRGASSLCPFGIIFEKIRSTSNTKETNDPDVVIHRLNVIDDTPLETISFSNDDNEKFLSLFDKIRNVLEDIRTNFVFQMKEEKREKDEKEKEMSSKRMLLTHLHIKPCFDEELPNLDEISSKIQNRSEYKTSFPLLTWKSSKIVPIGFGICKLVLECLMDAEGLDDLCESIMETEGEDVIQSVDIDWEATVPVGDAMNCLSKLNKD